MDILAAMTGILVLASLSEALVEFLISPIVKGTDKNNEDDQIIPPGYTDVLDWRDVVLRYCAAGVGVALCVIYKADIMQYFNLWSPWPWVGYVVTGLLIGRGSNFVHDFTSRWTKQPPIG